MPGLRDSGAGPLTTHLSQAERYAAELGDAARARQEELARERFVCCGEPKVIGHHEQCPKRPADAPAAIHEDQTALC